MSTSPYYKRKGPFNAFCGLASVKSEPFDRPFHSEDTLAAEEDHHDMDEDICAPVMTITDSL